MKILLLGASGSHGAGLADRSTAWGSSLPAAIERLTGELPELHHVRFYPWHGDSLRYMERQLEQGPFDVIILSQMNFGFTVWSVHNRVRKLLGNRAGDWLKQGVDVFDNTTRKPGDDGVRRKLNRLAHRSARKVIGQAPTISAPALTDIYLRLLARLARLEDSHVIVIASFTVSNVLAKMHPEVVQQTVSFREAIRVESERRRFDWIDRVAYMREAGGDSQRFFIDGVHGNGEAHSRTAAVLAEAIAARARVRPVAAPATGR